MNENRLNIEVQPFFFITIEYIIILYSKRSEDIGYDVLLII